MTEWYNMYKGFAGDDLIRMVAADVVNRLEAIKLQLVRLEKETMATLDDVQTRATQTLDAVKADTAVDLAVQKVVNDQVANIQNLKDLLAAAVAAGADPVKLQTLSDTLDAILAADTSNAKIVSDAVVAGTPVVPTPAPDAP